MNDQDQPGIGTVRRGLRRGSLSTAAGLLCCFLAVPIAVAAFSDFFPQRLAESLPTRQVIQDELSISITAIGRLECKVATTLECQVWNLGENRGTQLLWLIPNGTRVLEGDLLAEFDPSVMLERIYTYELALIRAKSRRDTATAKLELRELLNATVLADAQQRVELAELAQEAYQELGAEIARNEMARQIDDARSAVTLAEEQARLQQTNFAGIESLAAKGYRGVADVKQARLKLQQSEDALEVARARLATVTSRLSKFDRFDNSLQEKMLRADVLTARATLRQVRYDNDAAIVELLADKAERDLTYEKYLTSVQNYKNQLDNCTVVAPHDGIVVHEIDDGRTIQVGDSLSFREDIVDLPDSSTMLVRATVSQTEYPFVAVGQSTVVKVPAHPENEYFGHIHSVATVPKQAGYYRRTQVFQVIVEIEDDVSDLLPGMTATIEMDINQPGEVLQLPVEAVGDDDGQFFALVKSPDGFERRDIVVGASNQKMVEVVAGLQLGDEVALQPET